MPREADRFIGHRGAAELMMAVAARRLLVLVVSCLCLFVYFGVASAVGNNWASAEATTCGQGCDPAAHYVQAASNVTAPPTLRQQLRREQDHRGQLAPRFAAEDSSGIIYRTGSRTPNALTDSSGVSFRDSVSSSTSTENPQVFHPGDKIWGVDTAKLPPGSVVRDGVPAGHVSVFATPEEITAAIIDDPFLAELGLKPLDEFGAYRIPR